MVFRCPPLLPADPPVHVIADLSREPILSADPIHEAGHQVLSDGEESVSMLRRGSRLAALLSPKPSFPDDSIRCAEILRW